MRQYAGEANQLRQPSRKYRDWICPKIIGNETLEKVFAITDVNLKAAFSR